MDHAPEERPPHGQASALRAYAGPAGLALVLSALAPVETWHDGPCFLWQLAPDLRPASAWALLAPASCGAALLVGTLLCRRALSLAALVLASIVALFLVTAAGAEALAWDLLPQPEVWSHGPSPGLLAVALTAAGASLSLYPEVAARRAARALLAAAVPCAVAHLVLPAGDEPPVLLTARVLAHVASSSGRGNVLSAAVLSLVVLWPGVAVALGWAQARRPATRARSLPALLVAYGAPVTLLPFVRRAMASPDREPADAATMLGGVLVLAATLAALSCALSFLAQWAASLSTLPGRVERRTALAAVAVVVLAAVGTSRWARPAGAGAPPPPGPSTPEGDRLFGALLPSWNDARAAVDLHESPGADADAAEASLVSSGRSLGGDLGNALSALASESTRADLTERRWYGLVDRVNEASRRGGLPYYVDPTEVVGVEGPPPRRWFRVDAYRIEGVRRFTHAGRDLATLRVRALSPERSRRAALGLSRDVQPFAVVALDQIDAYRDELAQLAARTPPRCSAGPADSPTAEDALRACGVALAALAREGDLGAALLATTERHELQHQIDGPAMMRSRWLSTRLAFQPSELRDRVERELSAYLAQMTAPSPAPRLTLLRLLRMALLVRGGVEHRVALLAFEAMGEREAAPAYLRLDALDDAALRARAERAWREVYGGELGVVSPR